MSFGYGIIAMQAMGMWTVGHKKTAVDLQK